MMVMGIAAIGAVPPAEYRFLGGGLPAVGAGMPSVAAALQTPTFVVTGREVDARTPTLTPGTAGSEGRQTPTHNSTLVTPPATAASAVTTPSATLAPALISQPSARIGTQWW